MEATPCPLVHYGVCFLVRVGQRTTYGDFDLFLKSAVSQLNAFIRIRLYVTYDL